MDTDEIFRSSVEAARRSVARQGFTFMRVAGSDPRILELYSQKSKFTRQKRNSKSSSRIIEPLTASQFIKNSTLQSKRRKRKRSKFLPASKGSIAPRFMPQLKEAVKGHERRHRVTC